MNNIKFKLIYEKNKDFYLKPKPAIEFLPEWYKKTPTNHNNDFRFINGNVNFTYKKCIPFLDSLSFGYLILLNADIYIDPRSDSPHYIQWKINEEIISTHNNLQIDGIEIDDSFKKNALKWNNPWQIETPKGYSCLITHPLNRLDLPFYTLSGVVDTDKHPIEINFPFFMKSDFYGIIERGTPIAQIIPFKREDWKMKMTEKEENLDATRNIYLSKIKDAYKKIAWTRKSYR